MEQFINILILILIIVIIFYYLNKLVKKREHMAMYNSRLKKALNKNGYDVDINKYIITKCKNNFCKRYVYKSKNFNDSKSHFLAKNKVMSNKIFLNNNIPVPNHWISDNKNKEYYLNKFPLSCPCVLKPIDGMQGKDVHTFIKNKSQFEEILNKLLISKKYDKIMMENQVYGDNYRIFMFNNKIMDVIKREQPFVIGNGKDNLEMLINKKNKEQKEKNLFATTNLDWNYMKDQGYNKESIPKIDKKIFITNTINFHNGANPTRIKLSNIPQKNKELFIKAHKLIGLECSGIDYMSNNIYIPYDKNEGHIIEINDMVDTKIHVDADNKNNPDFLFNNIIKSLNQ